MKWIPAWLAKSYARLYTEKYTDFFEFEDAKSILKIEAKDVLSLRLTRLEYAGFLFSKRDSIDRRKKIFKLIEPNDVFFAYGIQTLSSSNEMMERLITATKKMDFVIGGDYASYIHTGYASPGKLDIYVNEKDRDILISLLSERFTSISIDDVLAEKTSETNVHIHSLLTEEMIDNSVRVDSIRYVSPETLLLEGLVRQNEFSLTDALVILIKKKKNIDFKKLFQIARSENVDRELGACMEIINLESKKKIFSTDLIKKNYANADLSKQKFFPKNKTKENIEYKTISDKWNLRITFSKSLISKIITDVVR